MTDEEMMAWIDDATYEQLLGRWRFAPAGDPFFKRGPVFDHYEEVMRQKRDADPGGHVAASKHIGWGEA